MFCGSSQGKKSSYQDAAIELGKELVFNGSFLFIMVSMGFFFYFTFGLFMTLSYGMLVFFLWVLLKSCFLLVLFYI